MCGFFANTSDWDIISIPPTMTARGRGRKKKDEYQKQKYINQYHQWTHTALDTNAGAEGLKLLRYLKCQLPGRSEYQGVKPLG